MKNSKIKKRIFIVGCPRSGTTFLQSLLLTHSKINSFPETHFFDRGFGGNYLWLKNTPLRGVYLNHILRSWINKIKKNFDKELPSVPIKLRTANNIYLLIDLLDKITLKKGKSIWVEKTPSHLFHIDIISSFLPNAIFIHIIRNGEDVVNSLQKVSIISKNRGLRQWKNYQDIEFCKMKWEHSIQESYKYLSNINHIILNYDKLKNQPKLEMEKLYRKLHINNESQNIVHYNDSAKSLIFDHEVWKEKNISGIDNNDIKEKLKDLKLDKKYYNLLKNEIRYI